MPKPRLTIPRTTRDVVLREFNHRCAVCGADHPHVHHIDENPTNNDTKNLIPLCPNCHLTDMHNPTARIEPARLLLFRNFKDPTILRSQFEPLFRRLQFLDNISNAANVGELAEKCEELSQFVSVLNMGEFYKGAIGKLTKRPPRGYSVRLGGRDPEHEALVRRHDQEYREQLRSAREQVYALAVELLRYQDTWNTALRPK
jgi:hypothetical protein